MLKIGDKIVNYTHNRQRNPVLICTIQSMGKLRGHCQHKLCRSYSIKLEPASQQEIEQAEKAIAERNEKAIKDREAAEIFRRKREADPRYPLLSRFYSGMEDWDKLNLEQLQTIADWLNKP